MDYIKIGGRKWNVAVTELSENFTILYSENTGRTMSMGARMSLDPLGTFYGHKITIRRRRGFEAEFDEFFDYVSKPRYSGIPVEIVHGQSVLSYDAYISNGERSLKRIDEANGVVYWDSLSLNIVPMEAQVRP